MGNIKLTKRDMLVAVGCVVFLIATLGSIGSGGKRRAKEAVCRANLRRLGIIVNSIAKDNNGKFPRRDDLRSWPETFWPYYNKRTRLRLCPEATKSFQEGGRNPFMAWQDIIDIGGQFLTVTGSYCINPWLSFEVNPKYWKTPYASGASEVPMFGGGQCREAQPYFTDEPQPYETDLWTPGPYNEMRRFCVSRHNGGVNLVYIDLSVRKVGLKYLWKQRWHREWPEDGPLPDWPAWMANFKDPE